MANIRVSIITIGDELLIGQTIDTNSAWMAQRLNELGIDVVRRVAVGDVDIEITTALDEELTKAEVVLMTGGLGPTADDITKPLLCKYFGGRMVVDEKTLGHIKTIFTKRNRPFLEANMKQAEVPDCCTVLHNRIGTAPGMLFNQNGKIIISMPGVPFEMMAIMEDEVLPYLQQNFSHDAIVHKSIITSGEGESFIAEAIKDLEASLPAHIKLAYLPSPGVVKLRLTGRGNDKLSLERELQLRQEELANRLESIVVSLHDLPLAQILGQTLIEKKATIGLAESCTGGYISHELTQIVGATRYFKGGIVCYDREVKENILGVDARTINTHTAVSEETAIEMVQGALKVLKVDYALSVTGMLGPAADNDEAPPGTVWMAVADMNTVKTRKFKFHYDRLRNKDMAMQTAIVFMWRFINNKL